MKLLYVCYNNKGRSPSLEGYTRHFLDEYGVDGVDVDSAGVGVESIESLREKSAYISRTTARILAEDGIDMHDKTIKHMGEVEGDWDVVLAADMHTLDIIHGRFPAFSGSSMLAKEFAEYKSGDMEIHGPYYHQDEVPPEEWTERKGYEIMLHEIRNVSRRIARMM
ncbi:MAG: hypothetical protein DRO99_02915 [Candidatus Aenigmatarchaeota archaeon]|nr:MAG: hypothetical protein DRO99_02915 [Candidatus Aenigmarchaeota archaeon]